MATLQKSFAASRNADWEDDLQFVSGGAPVDLTGAVLAMDVAKLTGEKQLKLRLGDGLTIVDATAGTARIFVPRARMFGLPAGSYVHDLLIMRGTLVTRIWAGTLTVDEGVTDV